MAAVSETIVREFFEIHGFLVCQQTKHTAVGRSADEDIDFFVTNPRPASGGTSLPAQLEPADLPGLRHAIVVVKGWHTEVFGPSVLARAPEIFRFLEPKTLRHSLDFFGADVAATKILVVPALPRAADARQQTIELIQSKGVDCVIPFHTILRDLVDRVEINRHYQKSDLLQTLRILKNYDLFKEPQLELFKTRRKARRVSPPENPG